MNRDNKCFICFNFSLKSLLFLAQDDIQNPKLLSENVMLSRLPDQALPVLISLRMKYSGVRGNCIYSIMDM